MFCTKSHAAAARYLYGENRYLVDEVLNHLEGSRVSDKMKALLNIAGKVQISGKEVKPDDIEVARSFGADDREIHDTVLIAACFSMFNRYVDGLATWAPSERQVYIDRAPRRAEEGYINYDLYK